MAEVAGTKTSSSEPLRLLFATLKVIRKILAENARTTNFNRALKQTPVNSHKPAIPSPKICTRSLDVAVDTWANEDAADRLHDLENMLDIKDGAPGLRGSAPHSGRGGLAKCLTNEPFAHALQTAFLFDVARGMWLLNKTGILHRDLKSANVLISIQGAVGAEQWMSPEEMKESPANEPTDVYRWNVFAGGVGMMVAHGRPFADIRCGNLLSIAVAGDNWCSLAPYAPHAPPICPRVLCPNSVGVVCFEVTTRMQPFKGMNLLTQDPAHRPKGFGPVVQTLASVMSHDGDPRNRSAVDADDTSSSGVKCSGGLPDIDARTTPATGSDGADASPRVAGKESGATALPPEAENVHAPIMDLPIVRQALAPSSERSGEYNQGTETVDEELSMKARNNFYLGCVGTHDDEERLYTAVPMLFVKAIWKNARSGTALFFHVAWKCPDYREMAKDLHNRAEGSRKEVTISENLACARFECLLSTVEEHAANIVGFARCELGEGKYAEADPLFLRAIDIRERTLDPDHHDLAVWLGNRAVLLANQSFLAWKTVLKRFPITLQGKYAEADPLILRAMDIGKSPLGPDHPDLALWLGNRACLLGQQEAI
ncbi:unnamed protein product [Ectocarpus sp. CCAP 1310/34]|nr:unnamed protein product [Ectocarpus sp. CCAP 1310/34]